MSTHDWRADVGAGIVTLGLWIGVWRLSLDFPSHVAPAQRYVQLLAGVLITLSIFRIVIGISRSVAASRGGGHGDEPSAAESPQLSERPPKASLTADRTASFLLGAVLYVVLMPRVGFVVASYVFMILAVTRRVGWSPKVAAVLALFVGALFAIFELLFGIELPAGLLI